MSNDNLQKLNTFFDKYIDQMSIRDIELLKVRNDELKFSYPYILLTSSLIDLFGGIEKGFKNSKGHSNSKERFVWFIREWMGRINNLYKEKSLAYLIYDSWRCGVSHQATLKRGFETSSWMYPKEKHLHYIEDKRRIFVHSIQFADDLITAQKLYREYINYSVTNTDYIDFLYQHLVDMIGDVNQERIENFNQLVQLLRNNNLVFNSSSSVSTTTFSTSTSEISSSPSFTRLPDELLPTVPSAAPNEDDLQ